MKELVIVEEVGRHIRFVRLLQDAKLAGHDVQLGKHAKDIRNVFEAIRQLMEPPVKPKPPIGFDPHKK